MEITSISSMKSLSPWLDKKKRNNMLTLQFIPYNEIAELTSDKRVKKLLSIVKQEKIVLLEGRLTKEEEAELIRMTMEEISQKFTGIELSVIYPESGDQKLMHRIKHMLVKLLLGDRDGFTIIGPASVVKEIKRDPDKIQLFTRIDGKKETSKSKKKK